MTNPNPVGKHWCFTINDPYLVQIFWETYPDQMDKRVRYCVAQLESAPETKREHVQGYIEFHQNTTRKFIQRHYIGLDTTCELMYSSRDAARAYCMKEETQLEQYREFGKWNTNGQGNRTDLQAFVDNAKASGIQNAVEKNPLVYVKYHAGLEKMYDYHKCDDVRRVTTISGRFRKGMFCLQYSKNDDLHEYTDGYRGQKTVFVPHYLASQRWLTQQAPLWLKHAKRWAEWVFVVYEPAPELDHEEDIFSEPDSD